MHANLLLPLLIIHLIVERLYDAFNHVDVCSSIVDWCSLHPSAFVRVHIEVLTLVSLSAVIASLESVTTTVSLIHL